MDVFVVYGSVGRPGTTFLPMSLISLVNASKNYDLPDDSWAFKFIVLISYLVRHKHETHEATGETYSANKRNNQIQI